MERAARRGKDFSGELREKGWYHSFVLPGGEVIEGYNSLEVLRARYARMPIPRELTGKRVLDIGAWDGWFSFEAERRGAAVTAIDCVEVPNFLHIHRSLASRVEYRILDFYELPGSGLAPFDYVFFLGVLYHLKHPLLALEIVCALTTDTAVVESFVIDADTWPEHACEIPTMEFYEADELGNQLDNWFGPSVGCLMAMCRAAGFARVELLHSEGFHAAVACHRKWEPAPAEPSAAPPELIAVANTRNLGINFSTRKEEYVSTWFRASRGDVARELLRLEVDGYGIPALHVEQVDGCNWMASYRLPPGLAAGWRAVRLRFADSAFGQPHRIAVDMPPQVDSLRIHGACDGTTWSREEVTVRAGATVTCWVKGLPGNADRANVALELGTCRMTTMFVGEPDEAGCRQVNAVLPADVAGGAQRLRVQCAGVVSDGWPIGVRYDA